MAENNQIVVGAMGRPFALGMLYSASKEELVPGITLWESETLKNITMRMPQESSNFSITASDSTEDSSFKLNVDASVKLSFMGGQIEVSGSANYLNDKKQFKNQSRVNLKYTATTHFEQLSLSPNVCKKMQNREMINKGVATHVVTGIEYGASAVFVFDSQKLDASEVQDVKGQMQVVIKKIPGCSIEGGADLQLSEEEKKISKSMSVTFYGDFLLESNPATFDAAVKTFMDLPKRLTGKDDKGNALPITVVPVRVWLLSLNVFSPKVVPVSKSISVRLVIKAEDALEDLAYLIRRCNDSLTNSTVGKFPQLHQQLSTFQKLCQYYTSELQRGMAEKCPAIREDKEDESALRSLFDNRDTPFNHEKLSKWLDDKEREINVIQFITELISTNQVKKKEIPILSTQSDIDRFVMSPDRPQCLGYIFTFVGDSDPVLDEMREYLNLLKKDNPGILKFNISDETLKNMTSLAENFKTKDSAQFIAAIPDSKNSGAALYSYTNGVLSKE